MALAGKAGVLAVTVTLGVAYFVDPAAVEAGVSTTAHLAGSILSAAGIQVGPVGAPPAPAPPLAPAPVPTPTTAAG